MRCPKCATTSFDYLDTCENCHTSMTALKEQLGPFFKPSKKTNWFELAEGTSERNITATAIKTRKTSEELDLIEPVELIETSPKSQTNLNEMDMDISSLEKDADLQSDLDSVLEKVLKKTN